MNACIDVVLLTKDNCSSISSEKIFRDCLKSYVQLPFEKFIVIDNSSDNTVEVIKEFFPSAKIIKSKALRGKARGIGIKHVTTEWFLFVDSDVQLCPNFLKGILRYSHPNVGALAGNTIRPYEKKIRKRGIWFRGVTQCVLVRTDLVKDIVFPCDMHIQEDHFLQRFIEKKGFRWIVAPTPISIHHQTRMFGDYRNECYEGGYMVGKYNLRPLVIDLFLFLKFPFKTQKERIGLFWQFLGRIQGTLKL